MGYRLFLDDLRDVNMVYPNLSNSDFIIVRSFDEFIKVIKKKGLPDFISFDNDLGANDKGEVLPEGYDAAKWLVYESGIDLSKLSFKVHSANPVAKVQIECLLDNYLKFVYQTSFNELVKKEKNYS